jgi:hypothetical protein
MERPFLRDLVVGYGQLQIDNADQIEMGAVAGARCFKGDPRPPRLVRPDAQW